MAAFIVNAMDTEHVSVLSQALAAVRVSPSHRSVGRSSPDCLHVSYGSVFATQLAALVASVDEETLLDRVALLHRGHEPTLFDVAKGRRDDGQVRRAHTSTYANVTTNAGLCFTCISVLCHPC